MSKKQTKIPKSPFCLRLSVDERTRLKNEAAAAGLSDSEHVRHQLFGADRTIHRTRGKNPVKDHQALGKILSSLGRSRLASNVNQLAKAANNNTLVFTPETQAVLLEACADIREMRDHLLKGMGVQKKRR